MTDEDFRANAGAALASFAAVVVTRGLMARIVTRETAKRRRTRA